MLNKLKKIFSHSVWTNPRTLLCLWTILAIVAGITKLHHCNNYKVFEGVFWHAWNGLSLYAEYPAEYWDRNLYGPLFSIIIAPFAMCPTWLGIILWNVAMTLCLYGVIRKLSITSKKQMFFMWFCAHELLTALFMQQFNIVIAAIIIGAWVFIEKEKEWASALLIVIGTFVKLYGIVGLAFFFFSKHKIKFIGYFALWSIIALVLPMAISSPEYIITQYQEWFECLTGKNQENLDSLYQNISLLGLVRRSGVGIFGQGFNCYSDLWLIIPGIIAFCAPYLRFNQWKNEAFRYAYLASTLLFVVLFSTGSESSGYIIAMSGVAIWYWTSPWNRGNWAIALMWFVFILTSLSPSDLFPKYLRNEWVLPYALKSLPCVLVWFWLVIEMLTRDYRKR